MQKKPIISVILPVYNCESYVREAVFSILKQTFCDFELIIINDGSVDSSGVILREIAKQDSRIILIERANKGLIFSLNEGIERSRGDLIARMDADDIAMPNRLAMQYAIFRENPDLAVLGTAVEVINSKGESLGFNRPLVTPIEIKKNAEIDCPIVHPTVMMRKEVVINVGGYRAAFEYCEDYDLWLRILDEGYSIANLPKILLSYRIHVSNISKKHESKQRFNAIVARLSHRMRRAGFPDPTFGIEKIDHSILESFPSNIVKNMAALLFVVNNTDISSGNNIEIQLAWKGYCDLVDKKLAKTDLSRFLIRLTYGAIKKQEYFLAIRAAWEAMSSSPIDLIELLGLELKKIFRMKLSNIF